jgi:hypothetical protein
MVGVSHWYQAEGVWVGGSKQARAPDDAVAVLAFYGSLHARNTPEAQAKTS